MPRHFRRRMRMQMPLRKTYKKVLNFAGESHAASAKIDRFMAVGVDSIAIGQTGPTDANVPTGSRITSILIKLAASNVISIQSFMHITVQHLHSGQGTISPLVVGGNPQRNQVHHQDLRNMSVQSNFNYSYLFRIPKKYQRMREGDSWSFTYACDQIWTDVSQIIYTVEL